MEQALTSVHNTGWRRLTISADLFALASGSMLALLWAGQGILYDLGFAAVYAAFVLGITRGPKLLSERLLASAFDSCADAVKACSIGVMLATATATLLGFSRPASLALQLWLLSVALLCATRVALSLIGQSARRHGGLMTSTLVVGAGLVGARVVRRLIEKPEYGLRPIGFLDADPMPGAVDLDGGVPVLGAPDELAEVCDETGARHVILAFASERDYRLVELVKRCRELGLGVSVVPRMYESVNERATLDHIGGLPLLSLKAVDPKGWQFAIKHMVRSPRGAGRADGARTCDGRDRARGEANFTRPGDLPPAAHRTRWARVRRAQVPHDDGQRQRGRSSCWRRNGARRDRGTGSPHPNGALAPRDLAGRATPAVERAPRRNEPGRARGPSGLSSPNSSRVTSHGYTHRHRVKSGITGWAQVNGLRGQTSIADRVEWDNHYIENWSLGLELRTIALTLAEILRFREDGPRTRKRALQAKAAEIVSPALALVEESTKASNVGIWFCGYCGATPASGDAPAPIARVCGVCGQGLMLESRSDVAPRDDEAFLVIDSRLTVQAVSRHAERVLGVCEQEATDRPVAELLVGADAERGEEESLTALLGRAAESDEIPQLTFVRPRGTFGVRLRARISACGPPRAALLVFESGPPSAHRPAHLQLVPADVREAKGA